MFPKEQANLHFKKLLNPNEIILWADKPTFIPYFSASLLFQIFGLIWFLIDIPLLRHISSLGDFCFYILHLFPFWLSCAISFFTYKNFNHIIYAYSKERIFIKDGIGANYTIIDIEKIVDIESHSSILDNKYNTASIQIYSGKVTNQGKRKTDTFFSIKNPVEVLVELKKLTNTK